MNTTFINVALKNMEPRLVRACALWAAARICEHDLPEYKFEVAVSLAIDALSNNEGASDYILEAANHEACPSGVRSALYAQSAHNEHNFRIHANHALTELAKQQGLHFVHAMLADLFETNTSPLEVAA